MCTFEYTHTENGGDLEFRPTRTTNSGPRVLLIHQTWRCVTWTIVYSFVMFSLHPLQDRSFMYTELDGEIPCSVHRRTVQCMQRKLPRGTGKITMRSSKPSSSLPVQTARFVVHPSSLQRIWQQKHVKKFLQLYKCIEKYLLVFFASFAISSATYGLEGPVNGLLVRR